MELVLSGNYALAAAEVLMETDLGAEEIAKKSIQVAAYMCFTNNNITMKKYNVRKKKNPSLNLVKDVNKNKVE